MINLFTPENLVALLTLTVLEIVLGIDNIVFISILSGRLPKADQPKARRLGLGLALVTRILLLLSLSWVISLETALFTLYSIGISGRDLILFSGGVFLIFKATHEIHGNLEGGQGEVNAKAAATLLGIVIQIGILDIVFSLDSVITAVGMAQNVIIMIAAVIIAIVIMMLAATPLSDFVESHPTVKILALSFLLLIGTSLIAEGMHQHIEKGYIYFAMGFSVFVEMLNLRMKRKAAPVHLHSAYKEGE